MKLSQMRRSDRIEIAIDVELMGMDLTDGQTFCINTRTLTVSRHGGAILLNHALAIDEEVSLRCVSTKEEVKARVVGLFPGIGEDKVYGLAFVEPNVNPWGIEFPSLTAGNDGLVRMLLACRRCKKKEVSHLTEIEIELFAANRFLQRFCKSCSAATIWDRVAADDSDSSEKQIQIGQAFSNAEHGSNRRKHKRVRTNVQACIRQSGVEDVIVTCEDVSRGGIRFRTSRCFDLDRILQIAVPYSAGGANIFVSARIAHIHRDSDVFVIGLSYASPGDAQKIVNHSQKSAYQQD
jgi:hypothetical protein